MKPFIFGQQHGFYILDVQQIRLRLEAACDFVEQLAADNGTLLFVAASRKAKDIVEAAAQEVNMPFVSGRWSGGLLTNFATTAKRIERLNRGRRQEAAGEFEVLSKAERLRRVRQLEKLDRTIGGISSLTRLPDALLIVGANKAAIPSSEARRLNIPAIALCNTDADPTMFDFPIPANDDLLASMRTIVTEVSAAVRVGKLRRSPYGPTNTERLTPDARQLDDAQKAERAAEMLAGIDPPRHRRQDRERSAPRAQMPTEVPADPATEGHLSDTPTESLRDTKHRSESRHATSQDSDSPDRDRDPERVQKRAESQAEEPLDESIE